MSRHTSLNTIIYGRQKREIIFFLFHKFQQVTLQTGVFTLVKDSMRGSRKFCQSGCRSDKFFLYSVDERIQIPLLEGHHGPASETPFKLRFSGGRADDGQTLNAGFVAL